MKSKQKSLAMRIAILISAWPICFVILFITASQNPTVVRFIVLIVICLLLSLATFRFTRWTFIYPIEQQEEIEARLSKDDYQEIYIASSKSMLCAIIDAYQLHLFAKLIENNDVYVVLQDNDGNEIYSRKIPNAVYFFTYYKFDKDEDND